MDRPEILRRRLHNQHLTQPVTSEPGAEVAKGHIMLSQKEASVPNDSSHVETEVEQAANAWMLAAAQRDVAALERVLAPEFSMVTNRGSEIDRRQWLDNMLHRVGANFSPPDFLDVRIRVYGDTAVMTSRNFLNTTFDGKDWSGHLALTDVWVRREGHWQLVRRHASNLVAGAA